VSELNRATEARNCFKTYQMSEAEKISLGVIVNNLEDEDTSRLANRFALCLPFFDTHVQFVQCSRPCIRGRGRRQNWEDNIAG
jgi:hypothetical protein